MQAAMHVERVMGTAVRFVTDDGHGQAINRATEWLRWVDRTFSVHRPDSEIMQIRRGDIAERDSHPEVQSVLDRCMALRIVSDGAFDHRPEDELDPSGYVKGWAIERAAELLDDGGRFCIDAGGDIVARGHWRVGIRDPYNLAVSMLVVELDDEAMATSGTYERGDHIWGLGSDVASVSVIGPDLGTADAISTALFSSPDDTWLGRFPGYEAITITADRRILTSPGVSQNSDGLLRVA